MSEKSNQVTANEIENWIRNIPSDPRKRKKQQKKLVCKVKRRGFVCQGQNVVLFKTIKPGCNR
jgi:hypothetical protein